MRTSFNFRGETRLLDCCYCLTHYADFHLANEASFARTRKRLAPFVRLLECESLTL
jgi:hypothetical protein